MVAVFACVAVFARVATALPLSGILGDGSPQARAESVAALLGSRSDEFGEGFSTQVRTFFARLILDPGTIQSFRLKPRFDASRTLEDLSETS